MRMMDRDADVCGMAGCDRAATTYIHVPDKVKVCTGHYQRWRRGASLDPPLGEYRRRTAPGDHRNVACANPRCKRVALKAGYCIRCYGRLYATGCVELSNNSLIGDWWSKQCSMRLWLRYCERLRRAEVIGDGWKICQKCKERKPLGDFYTNRRTHGDRIYLYPRSRCKRCIDVARRRPRRCKVILDKEVTALLIAQNYKCAYCGTDIALKSQRELDHIIPRSRCGSNDVGNLQWLCSRCNQAKGAMTGEEFIEMCSTIVRSFVQAYR